LMSLMGQVSDLGPSWPSCLKTAEYASLFLSYFELFQFTLITETAGLILFYVIIIRFIRNLKHINLVFGLIPDIKAE
jgi:hypothetical protein